MQSKIQETKDLMKKKAQEIEKTKIEAAKGGPSRMSAISSMAGGPSSGMGGGGRGDMDTGPSYRPEPSAAAYAAKEPARATKKGMQVGCGVAAAAAVVCVCEGWCCCAIPACPPAW